MLTRLKQPESSLVERTIDLLTENIINGTYRVGDLLPSEHSLCEQMGIGRSTLRETISILESQGLVNKKHGVGIHVTDRSIESSSRLLNILLRRKKTAGHDLVEMRRLYEVQAAHWAAERANSQDIERMKTALAKMKDPSISLEDYSHADLEFHMAVAEATHNSVLILFVQTIRSALHEAIKETLINEDYRPELLNAFHERIYKAVFERSPEQASEAMQEHMKSTEKLLELYWENAKSPGSAPSA